MSQKGLTTGPPSHRSSRSPVGGEEQVQLPSTSRDGLTGHERGRSLNSISLSNGIGGHSQIPPRTLDVHNILNPTEPQALNSGGNAMSVSSRSREPEATTPATPGPYSVSRPYHPTQSASVSHPGTPTQGSFMTPLGGPASERSSPITGFPFPTPNNSRRFLSPKIPRPASVNHGTSHRGLDPRQPPFNPTPTSAKRPFEGEGHDDPRYHPNALHYSGGLPPGSQPAPVRSISHPILQSPNVSTSLPPSHPAGHQTGHMTAHSPYQHEASPARSFANPGPSSDGPAPWTEMIRRHGMGAALVGGDGQQAYMTLPGSDTPIPVQVDYSQASKKADEKRQRNAVASTRHRRKKKIMQEESARQLSDLQERQEDMAIEIEQLKAARDFYRQDRNRLREVVARTPSLSEHATCPPSPSFPSPSSLRERKTSPATDPHGPTSQGYASETSSVDRPSQRRRLDDRPDYSMPMYETASTGPSTPTLPPMHGRSYGVPPRPLSASSGTSERLPPLRAMEGPPPPAGQAHEQDPRTGHWIPVQPRQHETGWATTRRP